MDTNNIRDLLRRGAQNWTEMAVDYIVDAIDELDERTRGEGEPEPGTDTCDCGLCSEQRLTGVSTIPGCHCRECRHSDARSRGGIYCEHPIFSPSLMALSTLRPLPEGYGCVFGERREAE